jgi:hypothetical protein
MLRLIYDLILPIILLEEMFQGVLIWVAREVHVRVQARKSGDVG